MTLETDKGTKTVRVYTTDGRVTSACVDMGYATLDTTALRLNIPKRQVANYPVEIAGQPWEITCVDMGNPHCVVFCSRVDGVDVARIGPQFEHAPYFPDRINTEFIRVVNPSTIKMRVWERAAVRRWPAAPAPVPRWWRRWPTASVKRDGTSRSGSRAATWWCITPTKPSPHRRCQAGLHRRSGVLSAAQPRHPFRCRGCKISVRTRKAARFGLTRCSGPGRMEKTGPGPRRERSTPWNIRSREHRCRW